MDKLYTSDFFELVASRLSAEGVFALWVPFAGMSADSFSLVLTTLQAVFPYVTLWNSGSGTVSAVGSLKPLTRPPDLVLAERFSDNRTIFERLKIKHPATLLGLQIATPWMVNGLGAKDIRVHTVEYPVLTYASARTLFIRDGTNYDSFWSDRLLRPGPSEDPTHQFLADQSEFTPEVLQDITDYYKNQGRMTSRIFEYKYLYRAKKAGQAVNGKTEAQAVAALRAVVDKVPLVVGGKSEEALRYKTQLLLTAYQRARLAGLKPHMEAVFHEYNWQCETWACAKLAQALLAEFLPLDQAKPYRGAMDLTSLEKRRALQRTLGDFARSINALAGN